MSCIEATFEVNAGIKGDLDVEQITADVVPAEAAATITEQQKTIEAQAERIDELENGPYPKAVSDTYAIAESMEATMPSELTPENLAATVATIPYSPTSWQRPSDWPNYDYIDKTAEEAIYLTYDTEGDKDFASFFVTGSNLNAARGYVDGEGWHAVGDGIALTSNVPHVEKLPTDMGRYVVYKLTGTLQRFNFANSDGTLVSLNDGKDAALQNCVEQFGYMPSATSIADGTAFSYCSFLTQNTVSCAIEIHATTSSISFLLTNGEGLVNLDLSGWQLPRVTMLNDTLLGNHPKLKFIVGLGSVITSNITTMNGTFSNNRCLRKIDLTGADFSSITSAGSFLRGCVSLVGDIDLSNMTSLNTFSATFASANIDGVIVLPDKANLSGGTPSVFYPFADFFSGTIEVLSGVESISNNFFDGMQGNGASVVINIHNDEGAISGAPWGATEATINYLGKD